MNNTDLYKAGKIILFCFVFFSMVSYFSVLSTGVYNGDFIGYKTKLSSTQLFFCLIITIAAFFFLFLIYRFYKHKKTRFKIKIPINEFLFFIIFCLIFNIIVSIIYGVGKAGQPVYQAPSGIKLLIQIFTRFNVFWGLSIYIFASSKKRSFIYLLFIPMILTSILSLSLGIFVSLFFFIIIQSGNKIILFLKKRIALFILIILIIPTLISILYNYRQNLRAERNYIEFNNLNTGKVITGWLVGRLSSFTNTAVILERKKTMTNLVKDFSPLQYFKEAIVPFYGKILDRKDPAYIYVLSETKGIKDRNMAFMTGVGGMWLLSLYQSGLVFYINIVILFVIIVLTFELVSLINCTKMNDLVFLNFCLAIMSGSANEFMSCLMWAILYILFFLSVNALKYGIKRL
jgi:hypothetical protein